MSYVTKHDLTSDDKSPAYQSIHTSLHFTHSLNTVVMELCMMKYIQDCIVVGLHVVHLSKKMQLEADLTLEKVVTQARQAKSVKQQ